MFYQPQYVYDRLFGILLFLPLVAAVIGGIWATSKPIRFIGYLNSVLLSISFLIALYFLVVVIKHPDLALNFTLWNFMNIGSFWVDFSFSIDKISIIMMLVVLFVSSMVHFYSIGYMKEDKSFNRFFAYLGGFVFSMLLLVGSDNFLVLFVGWEGVGLCSYLLIGFWYERPRANFASIESFVINRIADLGMLLGILLIFIQFGTLKYTEVFEAMGHASGTSHVILNWIGILLFIGAMGKSAQFPLHTWLADAMEGPTPVSALIHAATMVTAGVYLVIRAAPLYDLVPGVSYFIAILGAFVAVFAALMAVVNKDLKRVIAYSTLSQLGYMFVAAGLGAYWIALFHLFTHAFFKSLLFLCAGNVMHAMKDKLDIRKMGGLWKYMKVTAVFMTLGTIALCGIYPFAGYFSKDKILEAAFSGGNYYIWAALFIGAGLTAFYSFRLLTLVFFAPKNHDEEHPHEGSKVMLYAMTPLAVLSVIAGFVSAWFSPFISSETPLRHAMHLVSSTEWILIAATMVFVIVISIISILVYKDGYKFKPKYNFVHVILTKEYYIPQFYNIVFVKTYTGLSWIFWNIIDRMIIDKIVNFVGKFLLFLSRILQPIQNGNISTSLRLMTFGIVLCVIFVLLMFSSL
ncbi:NADH-quinone oxidoreductase subunit L [Helicobacter sp. 11S02629-2]|uniref:NADH-quinone oxidoreductase subunit L n=1 Tax=Helicobacter sp. 11S02629-2 TaxID=1476195 RepID=UPI000BA598C5|nr:NADH-quinone oxidoreductase subunit L [Helicobacter sp. 11S02629-2]PAF44990.1 NADH-quinone oxidoreductase subunit L [Helicobacter sp. 11S02629-2]